MLRHDEEAAVADEDTPTVAGLVLHDLETASEPADPRLTPADRPDDETLDISYPQQLAGMIRSHDQPPEKELGASPISEKPDSSEKPIYIDFEKGDRRNPANFSPARKRAILLTACLFSVLSSSSAGSYALGFPSMTRDLNCTEFQATIGVSLFALGFGVVPLVTASLSEEFGRQPLYLCSGVAYLLFTVAAAVAKNIQTVLLARFFAGAFASTGSTMVGGTVADLFVGHELGNAMSLFAATGVASIGIGCTAAGWIEQNPHLQWRWIQWIHVIFAGLFVVMIPIFMRETRASVLLVRMAKKMRKETGDSRIRARVEDERAALSTLIYISCTRPLYLLFTEPVIMSFSLWVGFAWGILYVLIESIGPVFRTLHGFNSGQEGTVFICLAIGTLFGLCTNIIQERLYTKNVAVRGPEARLYAPMAAALLFPISIFIYAWTTYSRVYWLGSAIGIVLIIWALFIIYLSVWTYLADCYGPFASSALAGQSLCRNLMGMAFPLFTAQMFARLTYHWANTVFAFVAVAMIPIPYVLFFYGPKIRARSKFASQVMRK